MNGTVTQRHTLELATGMVVALILGNVAYGETRDWAPATAGGGGTSAWATGTNWLGGIAPANDLTTDIARFDRTSYNVQPNAGTTSVSGIEIGDGTTAAAALTLAGAQLTLGASGVNMFANAGAATISSPIVLGAAQIWQNNSTNGLSFTSATALNNGGNTLTVGGSGNTTILTDIGGAGGLIKTGSGTLSLSQTTGTATAGSTFTGGVTVKSGTLIANGRSAAQSAAVFGTAGATLGDTSGSADATIQLNGGGNPIMNTPITVAAGSSNNKLQIIGGTGSVITSTGGLILNNNVTLTQSGAQNFTVRNISGAGNITIDNTGTLGVTMSTSNGVDNHNFTGNITVKNGLLTFNNSGNFNTNGAPITSASTIFVDTTGTLNWGNTLVASVAGIADVAGHAGGTVTETQGGRALNLAGSGSYDFSGKVTQSAAGTNFGINLSMGANGVQTLSGINNDFTGVTTLNSGTLAVKSLQNGGVESSLGKSTSLATNVLFHGGTLKYIGATTSTDRLFSLGKTGGTIDASGTGAVNFTNTGTIGTYFLGTDTNPNDITGTLTLTGSNAGLNTLAAKIGNPDPGAGPTFNTGTTSLTKSGGGTWVLTNANTYTGPTTVTAGKLLNNGSITSAVTVNGGLYGGSGTTSGLVTIGAGTVSAGNSPGSMTLVGGLSLTDSTSHFLAELTGTTAGTQYDQVIVTGGSVSLGGATLDVALGAFVPADGTTFTILDNLTAGGIGGTFAGLAEGSQFNVGSVGFQISYVGGTGNDIVLTTVAAVPEPTALALLPLIGFMGRRRRN